MAQIATNNLPENAVIVDTHINEIKVGDTIFHEGHMRTVCRNNLNDGFMGRSVFGDSYANGKKMVKNVIFTCKK